MLATTQFCFHSQKKKKKKKEKKRNLCKVVKNSIVSDFHSPILSWDSHWYFFLNHSTNNALAKFVNVTHVAEFNGQL